jgi:HSP20 family protein
MSNIMRRNEVQVPTTTNPFRLMRDLMRWDPFREMEPSWFGPSYPEARYAPAFEVRETKDGFVFKADLPGVKDKDVEIKLTGTRLAISGKRDIEHEDKNDTFFTYERTFGSFVRTFTLPDDIDHDHVGAELKEGVLTVSVPKKAAVPAKTIAIKPGEAPKS